MANWRKQQGQNHHQGGHWRSYDRRPPLDNQHSTVPSWEKKFCASVGSIPWRKVIESQKYMSIHDNVLNWDDSAVKEAFDKAKRRFWAQINGFPCDISLPDPDMYIDNVDWDSGVDPELVMDLESEAKVEERDEGVVILGSQFHQSYSPTGWGDEEEEIPKPFDPNNAAQGCESNLHENNEVNSWEEQHCAPVEQAKECEWNSQGWNQREHHEGDLHYKAKGRTGWNGNWGTWDGYDTRREHMSWSKTSAYHGNEYQINRGRRNNRGGRKGNFAYDRPYVDKVPSPCAW